MRKGRKRDRWTVRRVNHVNAEVDFTHVMKVVIMEKIQGIIKSYRASKTKDAKLKMKMLLADEKSVCERLKKFHS